MTDSTRSGFPEGFSARLKSLMDAKGFSAYDLASAAKLTHTTIYSWLDGRSKRPPARENVERVASALGATYVELWGEAPLGAGERTRLVQLESFARRVQELLDEIRPAPEPEPEGEAVDAQPQAVYREEGGVVREVPRKRRAKGA